MKCSWCGNEVNVFRSATTGQFVFVDPLPVEDGDVIVEGGFAHTARGDLFDQIYSGPRYKNHAATCPKLREKLEKESK